MPFYPFTYENVLPRKNSIHQTIERLEKEHTGLTERFMKLYTLKNKATCLDKDPNDVTKVLEKLVEKYIMELQEIREIVQELETQITELKCEQNYLDQLFPDLILVTTSMPVVEPIDIQEYRKKMIEDHNTRKLQKRIEKSVQFDLKNLSLDEKSNE